jgi:hypothetical protein
LIWQSSPRWGMTQILYFERIGGSMEEGSKI